MLQSISFVFQERTSYRLRITLGWLKKRISFSFLSDLFNIFVYSSTTNNSSTAGSLDVQCKYPQIYRLKWWQVRHNGGKIEDRRMREDESQLEKREARTRKKKLSAFHLFYYFQSSPQKLTGSSVTSRGQRRTHSSDCEFWKGAKGRRPHTRHLRRCSGERNWNPQQPRPTNKWGRVVISGSHLRPSCCAKL